MFTCHTKTDVAMITAAPRLVGVVAGKRTTVGCGVVSGERERKKNKNAKPKTCGVWSAEGEIL